MRPAELVVEGGITEIFGRTSSGRTSLLVACLREVTRRGAMAALVDTDHVFDPRGAARAGVELSRVLWIRCGRRTDRALRAADLLVRCPGWALVALDTGAFTPPLSLAAAYRLKLAVLRARTGRRQLRLALDVGPLCLAGGGEAFGKRREHGHDLLIQRRGNGARCGAPAPPSPSRCRSGTGVE